MSQSKASEAVRKETERTLSKYTTPQLTAKLEAGKLLGLSKEVATSILEKRAAKGSPVVEQPKVEEKKEESKEKVPAAKKEKVEKKEKTPKAPKIPKEKKEKKVKEPKVEIEKIDEEAPKVKTIMENENFNKSDKIRELLGLGYSVNQISAKNFPTLNAHYSQVHGIANPAPKK